jgi:hypothetical protein
MDEVYMRDVNFEPYMAPQGPQRHITESYVSSPPALIIVDEAGIIWTLGLQFGNEQGGYDPRGEYCFEVLANGNKTGEFASRIERRSGRIRIFTRTGWKRWSGRAFV